MLGMLEDWSPVREGGEAREGGGHCGGCGVLHSDVYIAYQLWASAQAI